MLDTAAQARVAEAYRALGPHLGAKAHQGILDHQAHPLTEPAMAVAVYAACENPLFFANQLVEWANQPRFRPGTELAAWLSASLILSYWLGRERATPTRAFWAHLAQEALLALPDTPPLDWNPREHLGPAYARLVDA